MKTGFYLYCIAKWDQEEAINLQGIQGKPVFLLEHRGLVAVVQESESKPFASEDQKVVTDWLLIHQNIVDWAWERYETVIPFGFDTIIVATDGKTARQNLMEWIEKEAKGLQRKLAALENKAEYGVQVLWDPAVLFPKIHAQDAEIKNLEKEIQTKPKGTAYLLRKKWEDLVRQRMEAAADSYFKDFFKRIGECVEAICVEKIRKEESSKQMIMNVSCLQKKNETSTLGALLEKIGRMPGFDVRFTGPWPPYSFAKL